MKKRLFIAAATCGSGALATLQSAAAVAVRIGVPVPGRVYVGAPTGRITTAPIRPRSPGTGAAATTTGTATDATVLPAVTIGRGGSERGASQ